MFNRIFESESPPYALPGQADITPSTPPAFLYNEYLITPPRIYAEEISGANALFVNRERTLWSDYTIHLWTATTQIYGPGYNFIRWRFDGVTGAYLDRTIGVISDDLHQEIFQSRDGSLWRVSGAGTPSIYELDPVTFEEIPDSLQLPSKFGQSSLDMPLVDKSQNLIIMRKMDEIDSIGVWNFTTGALIRRIVVSGTPADIVPEDERRCYVLTTDNLLNLVDYTTGKILSTLRAPDIEAGALGDKLAWDRYYRRLLIFTQRDNAMDGASLSSIAGYYPLPLAVGITKPIPLLPPRKGRTVPLLTRAYGDAGEPIPGVRIAPAFTGTASLIGSPPASDTEGYAIVNALCDDAGGATLDVSATV
jgi:hypothetical protein